MSVEDQIISFFGVIEKEVQQMEYGTMTVNVYVGKGLPILKTTNIVKSKRIRYKVKENDKKVDNLKDS